MAIIRFPSPSGDHAFSNSISTALSCPFISFRPLQGIMHLATKLICLPVWQLLSSRFRPLQGIMHLAT